jgi:hypothetical protein
MQTRRPSTGTQSYIGTRVSRRASLLLLFFSARLLDVGLGQLAKRRHRVLEKGREG